MWVITRKGKLIQEQILDHIENATYPLSSRQLAVHLGYSWNTIQQHCLELLVRNKLQRFQTPGAHLWIAEGRYQKKKTVETIEKQVEKKTEDKSK